MRIRDTVAYRPLIAKGGTSFKGVSPLIVKHCSGGTKSMENREEVIWVYEDMVKLILV